MDKIYYSALLAREFAPDIFTDYHDNQVRPGLFDANYLYVSGTTSPVDSCSIQRGRRYL